MKEVEIISYNSQYREKLLTYLNKLNRGTNKNYIDYCVDRSEGDIPSIIVIDKEKDVVVGCHLFFSTKMYAKGEVKSVAWGHETYLDEDFRGAAGLEFVLSINCNNSLGIGYSDINREVQKRIKKNVLMETVFNYFLLNIYFPLGVINKIIKRSLTPLKRMEQVKTAVNFRLAKNADSIVVPDNGFWFKDQVGYDLIRDKHYLNYRFFNNRLFDYSVYEYHNEDGDSCYFVVRPILYRGIPAVLLVDYRFHGNGQLMRFILDAVKIIARRNHIGVIQTTGGMKEVERVFDSPFCIKRHGECMIHKSLSPASTDYVSVTPADSDVDFNR